MNRSLLLSVSFVVLCLVAVAQARAAVEYCPASVRMTALGTGPTRQYSAVFYGGSRRLVSGTVAVRTERGWFSFPFKDQQLVETPAFYRDDLGGFDRTEYQSFPIYIRFSQNVTISYTFVNTAIGTHDESFTWNDKGLVSCQSADDMRIVGSSDQPGKPLSAVVTDVTPNAFPSASPKSTAFTAAVPIVAPGQQHCAVPFSDATVVQLIVPQYPPNGGGKGGRTIVAIAIDAEGRVGDAWTWRSSGTRAFDAVAAAAARLSTFTPKRAFCQAVPGVYFIVADFAPPH